MFDRIIGYGDTYMPLITLIVFLIVKKNIRKEEQCFIYFLVADLLLFSIINILPYTGFNNNLFLYHFYYVFELVFVTYYITKQLLNMFKPLFYIVTGGYILFWLVDVFMWESLNVFSSYAAALQKITILFLCMYYMLTLAKTEDTISFQKLPGFWIASGFLISSAMGIFSAVAYKYYVLNNLISLAANAWMFESIGTILKFTFIITGFLCYKRNPRFPCQSPTFL